MKPVVDRLRKAYAGKVTFIEYDALHPSNQTAQLITRYGIAQTPTFVFLDSGGFKVDTIIGQTSEESMRSIIDTLR